MSGASKRGAVAPFFGRPSSEGRWRAIASSLAGISEAGTLLQVISLTGNSRRPLSRRSPSLRETRATLRASSPDASQAVGSLRALINYYCAVRQIYFALRHIPIRGVFSGANVMSGASKRGAVAPFFGRPSSEGRWRAIASSLAGISEAGTLLQVISLTGNSRRPLSRRSPSLRETRATLRASSPDASQAFGSLRAFLGF